MENDKWTELMLQMSNQISAIQKDVEYLKTEINSNYKRSDEADAAVRELVEERTKYAANRQDAIKAELLGQINLTKKENELNLKMINALDERIKALEGATAKKVLTRWEKVKDYLFTGAVIVIVALIIAWLGIQIPAKPF